MISVLYDFETLISKAGIPRKFTIPIELALFIPATGAWYHSKMWPLAPYGSDVELRSILDEQNVRVGPSLSCIRKIGRISTTEQGIRLAELEDDMLDFLPQRCQMIAHNGKSFDDHILKHWFPRIAARSTYCDSLRMLRDVHRNAPLKTYSLPVLTKPHRREIAEYMRSEHMPDQMQHRALYDVVALNTVLNHHGCLSAQATSGLSSDADLTCRLDRLALGEVEWEDLKGIGPVTAGILRERWETPEDFKRADLASDILTQMGISVKRIASIRILRDE